MQNGSNRHKEKLCANAKPFISNKKIFVAALRCNPKRHNMVFLWNFSCGQRIITGCQPRGVLLGMFRVCFVQQDFAYAS